MGETGPQPRLVQALHSYKGQNNDELCLHKGDMITVTQALDGGWWEGTLREQTGWFPSNYVKEVKDNRASLKAGSDLAKSRRESMIHYHSVVLQNIIETERTFVKDLKSLLHAHLRPLNTANILAGGEFSQLSGNLEELTSLHESLLVALEDCAKEPLHQQRVGGIFLKLAPSVRGVYRVYCSNHPRAVNVVQTKKDDLSKFMESRGAPPPGVMTLTSSLATPFTRLDKYPLLLKELERHTDESHIDRGDTQRAICVYKDIATASMEVRKLKELEYDIMGCDISGWEGEPLSTLGEVLHLSHVQVQCDNTESRDRLLLLFPGLLVILSVSPRLSGYTYQGKLPTSGLTVKSLEDTDTFTNAFELSGSMVDQRIVSCLTSQIRAEWIELLRQQAKLGPTRRISVKPQSLQVTSAQPSISTLSHAQTAYAVHQPYRSCRTTWSMSCLRPCPPLRPSLCHKDEGQRSPRTGRRILGGGRRKAERSHSEDEPIKYKKIGDSKTLEDDAYILKVIEAYCTSARARQTVNSLDLTKIRQNWNTCVLLDSPQILIAEEEKIIVEEMKGTETVVEEKSLVDTVYSLKDQVHDLKQEQGKLRRELEEERRARKRLEVLIRKSLKSMVVEPVVMVSAATTDESTT